MLVEVTVEHIEVMKNDVVFLLSCRREDGKEFQLQFCEGLKNIKDIAKEAVNSGEDPKQAVKNHLLERVGKMCKENVEAEDEKDEQGNWKRTQEFIGKVFTINTDQVE